MDNKIGSRENNVNVPERVIVSVLAIVLFACSAMLYARDSRPMAEITVEKGKTRESLTLFEIEARLKEAGKVPINTASIEELTAIPGIGPVMAGRIAEYRQRNGRFYNAETLLDIKGIGPVKLEKMREYINLD